MAGEMKRFYELLREQGRELSAQGKLLERITQSQSDQHERLFGSNGQPGAIQFIHNEVTEMDTVVATHTRQISFWRGGIAVLAFLWTAAVAVGSVVVAKHR